MDQFYFIFIKGRDSNLYQNDPISSFFEMSTLLIDTVKTITFDNSEVDSNLCWKKDNVFIQLLPDPTLNEVKCSMNNIIKTMILNSQNVVVKLNLCLGFLGRAIKLNGAWILKDGLLHPKDLISILKNICNEWSFFKRIGLTGTLPKLSFHIITPSTTGWKSKFLLDIDELKNLSMIFYENLGLSLLDVHVNRFFQSFSKILIQKTGRLEKIEFQIESEISPLEHETISKFGLKIFSLLPIPEENLSYEKINRPPIMISKPCIYIFSESSGQGAIFAMSQYNLVINCGNLSSTPETVKMSLNMPTIDCLIISEWSVENAQSFHKFSSLVVKSSLPKCICLPFAYKTSFDSTKYVTIQSLVQDSLKNLSDKNDQIFYHLLKRDNQNNEPIILYQKLGEGTLELYPLTPQEDDFKDEQLFNEIWIQNSENLLTAKSPKKKPGEKISSLLSNFSTSFILVWKCAEISNITKKQRIEVEKYFRILFISKQASQENLFHTLESFSFGINCSKGKTSSKGPSNSISLQKPQNTKILRGYQVVDTTAIMLLDVAWVPNSSCEDVDKLKIWFSKIRAATYIICHWCPQSTILKTLIEVKKDVWDKEISEFKFSNLSVIFTHDSESLLRFIQTEEDNLKDINIKILGFANRSQIRILNDQNLEELIECIKLTI